MAYYAEDASSIYSGIQNQAAGYARARGLTRWNREEEERKQRLDDFGNYLSSGNYTTENNQKYRDMATQAVADLDEQMKRYSKSSNEYKQLDAYKQYYSNALPTFDRVDVGLNAQNYISADGWHSEDDYKAQRSALQSSIDNIQAEMDAMEDKNSNDYKSLESYRNWYQKIMDGSEDEEIFGLAQREAFDRQYKDLDEYTKYQRAQDYGNNVQTQKTLEAAQDKKAEAEAAFKQAQIDYNLGKIDYQTLVLADQEVKKLDEQIGQLSDDLSGLQSIQAQRIQNNFVNEYGEYADYQKLLDDLVDARNKAEQQYGKDSDAYAKIDLEIKTLAGANENGTNASGKVDNSTLYGRYLLRNFDTEAAQKEMDEIDAKLKEYGLEGTGVGAVISGISPGAIGTGLSIHQDVASPTEESEEIRDLRERRVELSRMLSSSEALRSKKEIEENLPKVDGFDHFVEVGKGATRNNNSAYVLPGYDAEEASLHAGYDKSGSLGDFSAIAEDEEYKDLANLMYAAIGAEAEGVDIGYTIQDILDAYGEDYTAAEGHRLAKKINDIDNNFLRWNAQVLGTGTQAGLNQFVSGLKQEFSTDYIAPNSTAVMAQETRQNIGKNYGDGNFLGTGSNFSQVLFDTTQTTANMLPMIVASTLIGGYAGSAGASAASAEKIGQIAGATLMGLSSAGNSYQQAISEGWDRKDAMLYSNLMGAAEGGLQYAMGGISKLGGGTEWQDALLNAAKGINNGLVRWMAETGTHIAGEVSEELLQNRIERFLRNQLNAENNEVWAWDDDDWNTVIITALSTGAMEGPGVAVNLYRNTKTGKQLSGAVPAMSESEAKKIQGKIESKDTLSQREIDRHVISEIGKAMQGDPALNYTLLTIGENMMYADGEAHELASRMASGKAAKNATNYGELYNLILNEFVERNGAGGYDVAMMAVIGGAVKYHELAGAKTAVEAANAQAAEVRKANPGAEVLDLNTSEMVKLGATQAAASELSPIINKVLSGTDLTGAEMDKLLGDSRAAQAARVLLGQQSGDPNTIQQLRLSLTRGNAEGAREVIQNQIQEAKDAKKLRKAADKAAVEQAAMDAANQAEVSIAARNADLVPASTVKAVQKADTAVENAKARQSQIERMSYKELGNAQALGLTDTAIDAGAYTELSRQMAELNDRADKLAAIKFPSKQQATELADIRQQQAALKAQMVALDSDMRQGVVAKAAAKTSAAAPAVSAQTATGTDADVANIPTMGEVTRAQFVKDFLEANPNATIEQANAQFDEYAAMTGGVKKGNVENGQTTDQNGQRNDVGDEADRGQDREQADRSEQIADQLRAGEIKELRTEPGGDREGQLAAYVTKDASVVDGDHIDVLADEYKDLPDLVDSLKRSGFRKTTFVVDGDILNALGESVPAVYNDGELFLRLDYPSKGYDYIGTAEHERLHLMLDLMRAKFGDTDARAFVSSTLQNLLGQEAFTKAFDAYAMKYGPVYLQDGRSLDDVAHMICEEMLCDMVGGINNFGTDLGDYLEDAEGILEASKFNVVLQNLVDNPDADPGSIIMEEIDKNALPYGIPADTLLSSQNVDNPSTAPANVDQASKFAFFGLADALGFKVDQTGSKNKLYYLNDEDARLGRNGFTQVTVDMIKQSPIGDLIRYSVDKGDITADQAEQEYNMFASIASITAQTNDFFQAMQFMGSTIFTALKKNSDTQYGTTYDFPSICTKTQATINEMSAQMVAKGRSLTEDEIKQAYNNVFNDGNPVPCPECYVFSRWVGIGGLLDNIRSYQERYGAMSVEDVIKEYDNIDAKVTEFAEKNGLSKGRAKGALAKQLDKQHKALEESIQTRENQGEFVPQKDYDDLAALTSEIPTIRALTWINDVYFAGKAHTAANVSKNFVVPLEVLYDLNEGETFARDYKDAWAFRTTQGAGYGKAITPYAEAILGEGMLVTTNTSKNIKAKAKGTLNNPYRNEHGKITESSTRGKNLKSARQKQLNQLFIGGQRLQSTSDARFDNAVDYLLAALELQSMQAGAQVYTKVPGAVAFFNICKMCTNMSMMPKGGGLDSAGTPIDTEVGGMALATMALLRKQNEYAGSITIGVNDAHIRALMAQEFRDFIIPYHASGGKMGLIEYFRQVQDPDLKGTTIRSSDYTKTQSDKILSDDLLRDELGKTEKEIKDIHKFRETRLWILTNGKTGKLHEDVLSTTAPGLTESQINARGVLQELYVSMQKGGKWNDGTVKVQLAKGKVEHQIFPNEFWDTNSTYENSSVNTQRYLDYCDSLGFLHRFSGKTVQYNRKTQKSSIVPVSGYDQNGQKVELTDLAYKNGVDGEIEPFFWKTLTDRRMYGNNGQYLEQPRVDLTNLKAETVATFAEPMGERRYNHKVSMLKSTERAANVSRMSTQTEASGNAVGAESDRVRTGSEVQGETQTEVSRDVGRGVSEGLGEENRRQTWGELDPAEREAITSAVVPFLEKNMTWEGKEIRSDFQSDEDFLEFLYDRAYQPNDENGIVFENEAGYFVKNPSALFDLINETKKTETLGKSREDRSESMIAQTTQDVKSIDEGTQHGPQYSLRDNDESNPYPADTLEHDLLNLAREGDAEAISKWLNQKMNEREDKLENAKMRAPIIPTRSFVPKVSEQEKAALDKTLNAALDKYGPMRPSEKSNGFVLPAKNQAGQNLRRGLQNIGSAKQITKEAQDQLERFAFTDVAATYVPDSNEKDIKAAKTQIQDLGLDRAKAYFSGVADSTKAPSTQDIALGEQLLIQTSREGDMRGFLDVLSSVCEMSTQIGKSLQAFRMLKQSGPIGELYYVQKAVSRLNKKLEDKIERGKANTITVKDELSKAVLMAPDAETREKAMDALIADIASQVPVTLKDKWDSWRYLAMLGNARTHIRNIVGNAVFVPLRYAKDLMAAGGELIATQAGWMEEGDRTKALAVSRELRDFAASDADVYKKELQGNGKYNPAQEIMEARRVLPGFLDALSRKNGDLLEEEDWMFLRPAYIRALSQALTHTGYTVEELQTTVEGKRALNNARRLAIEEAQKATYRDFSAVASALNRIKKLEGKSKIGGVLLEGVLPFTKTPINILKRGVEYSPLGIASAIGTAVQGARNGNLNVAQFIDELSAGLTGTAVAALGWLLARMGILRGKKKDEKEEGFEKLQGYQDYSIQLGDFSFTIDWAAPTALPLFTGATIVELMENSEDLQWKDAWNAMMMIAEPMMSLSMLDGLNNVLSAGRYGGENDFVASVVTSAFTSYLGQAIPTLGGQIARTLDGTRRSTYVDKNSPLPAGIQRFIQASVQNKIPIWESQKTPYIDAWGREDNASSVLVGAFENFISPAYLNMVHTTDVDQTLQELYASTKEGSVLPETPGKSFSVNGATKNLTADEYVSYARDVGSTKYALLTQLFSDPRYLALSDEDKAKAVKHIYDYATAAGKYHVTTDYHIQAKWIREAEAMQNETLRFNRIWEAIESSLKD